MHQNELLKTRDIVYVKWLHRGNNWAVVLHRCRRHRNFNRSLALGSVGEILDQSWFRTCGSYLPILFTSVLFADSCFCHSLRISIRYLLFLNASPLITLFIPVWKWFEKMTAIIWPWKKAHKVVSRKIMLVKNAIYFNKKYFSRYNTTMIHANYHVCVCINISINKSKII